MLIQSPGYISECMGRLFRVATFSPTWGLLVGVSSEFAGSGYRVQLGSAENPPDVFGLSEGRHWCLRIDLLHARV